MAQQPESGRNASGIARASKRKWGYNPAQVDEFLERTHALYDSGDGQLTQQDIQNVSFDLCKGGYVISQVDAALGRLERAVVDQQTTREITRHGRVVWKAQTEDLYRSLAGHAQRAAKERFRPGEPKSPSYDRKQVDRLIDQVIDKAAAELGVDGVTADDVRDLTDLNSTSVANVIFTQRKGKRGYDERQVDNYLNACVRLLSRLESYARVAEYVHDPATVQSPAPTPVAAPAAALFPPRDARPAYDGVSSPTVMDNDLQTMPPSFAPTPQQDSAPAPVAAPTPSVTPTPVATPMPSVTPMSTPDPAPTAEAVESTQPSFAQPAAAPVSSGDALSDLERLAASTQMAPEPSAAAPTPSLDVPSAPSIPSIGMDSMQSLDIPDLSFPTFDTNQPAQKKPEL